MAPKRGLFLRAGITGTIVWLLAVSACTGLVIDPAGQDSNGADVTLANQGSPGSQPPEEISGFVPTQIRDDIKASDENVAAPPACDLAISQVAAYQSIKTVLWQEGKIVEGGALLVAGKATLFRAFASRGPRWADRLAKARLTLTEPTGSVRVFEAEKLMVDSSIDGNGASTFNFSIQGSSITTETRYQVELDMGEACRRFESSRSAPRQGPPQHLKPIVRTSLWPKSIRALFEVLLVNGLQHHRHRAL